MEILPTPGFVCCPPNIIVKFDFFLQILQEIKGESEKQAPIAEQEIIQPLPMVKYTCVLLLMYIN